jgi:hypothetical protein
MRLPAWLSVWGGVRLRVPDCDRVANYEPLPDRDKGVAFDNYTGFYQ